MSILVYELNWAGPSICYKNNDGLWDNNNKIALHVPIFKLYNNDYKKITINKLKNMFYIKYHDKDYIKKNPVFLLLRIFRNLLLLFGI